MSSKRVPLFYVLTALFWFSLYAYVPFVSPYAQSLHADIRLIGLIAGSYGFVQMIVRIPLGIFSDVLKKRKIFIIIGVVFAVVSGLGVFLFPAAHSLLIFRGASGVAAASWVIFTILFSSYFRRDESVKAIGFLNASNSLGTMAALLIGGVVARSFGMEHTFLLAAAVGCIALVLSFGIVENKDLKKEPIKLADILEIARDKNLMMVSLLAIVSQYLVFTTTYGFTPLVAKGLGAGSFQIGLLSMTTTLPGIFVSPLAGTLLLKRFGASKTLMGGFFLAAAACIAIPWSVHLPALYITQFIGGIGTAAVFPLLMGLSIKNIPDNKRATAMGFFQAIYGVGMFVGPAFGGLIGDRFGLSAAFVFTGVIGFCGCIAAYFYKTPNVS